MRYNLTAGEFGPVSYVRRDFDAVFIVIDGGILTAVGSARASEKIQNVDTVYFYGWVIDNNLYRPGGRVPVVPTLVWRVRSRKTLGDISKNTLEVLRPGCKPDTEDILIDGWIDTKDYSGGVYTKEGLYNIDTRFLIHGRSTG